MAATAFRRSSNGSMRNCDGESGASTERPGATATATATVAPPSHQRILGLPGDREKPKDVGSDGRGCRVRMSLGTCAQTYGSSVQLSCDHPGFRSVLG